MEAWYVWAGTAALLILAFYMLERQGGRRRRGGCGCHGGASAAPAMVTVAPL